MFILLMIIAVLWLISHIVIVKINDKKLEDWESDPEQGYYGRKQYPSFCEWYNNNNSACTTMTVVSILFICASC